MELHESPANVAFSYGRHVYVRAPQPVHFPSEERPEEHVSETKRHLEARTTLYLVLKEVLAGTAAIGSRQFVYVDASDPRRRLSPDAFVKRGAREEGFDTWKVWERGAPELAVEIVSGADPEDMEWSTRLACYHTSGIAEVVRFDPEDDKQPVRVWDRVEDDLVERHESSPALRECVALGLWWSVAPSPYGPQLRLARDPDGKERMLTPDERAQRLRDELAEVRMARRRAEEDRRCLEQERIAAEEEREDLERKLADGTLLAVRSDQERAEQAQRLAEEKLLAEQKSRREAEAEAERLRAELRRLRGESG